MFAQKSRMETPSPRRVRTSLSPAREIRVREKEEITHLNTRLANYIDKVRSLEQEVITLRDRVSSSESSHKEEITSVQELYRDELEDARKLLDEVSRQRAKLQIDNNKYKVIIDDDLPRLRAKEKELTTNNEINLKNLAEKEARVSVLAKDNRNLSDEVRCLQRQLDNAKCQLEQETLDRVSLENKLQTLKEELEFKTKLYENELKQVRTTTSLRKSEYQKRKDKEFDDRITAALQDMRHHHELALNDYKEDKEAHLKEQLANLNNYAKKKASEVEDLKDKLTNTSKTTDQHSTLIITLENKNQELQTQLVDCRKQMASDKARYESYMKDANEQIRALKTEIEDQVEDYQDLLDEKLNLDMELAAYGKMIEAEETRLNIPSPAKKRSYWHTPRSGKRRRLNLVSRAETIEQNIESGVEICEVDPNGGFIRIKNTKESPISFSSATLKRICDDTEETFKFAARTSLKPGSVLTVYASGHGTPSTDDPSNPSIFAKQISSWSVGDRYETTLKSSNGNLIASNVSKNVTVEEAFPATENQQSEKCVIS